MTYYVITAGSYSDYHIIAITSDKKKAESFVEEYNKRESLFYNARVEEYREEDFDTYTKYKYCYTVVVWDDRDSEVFRTSIDLTTDKQEVRRIRGRYTVSMFLEDDIDPDIVKKMAYDKIAEYKAEKEKV